MLYCRKLLSLLYISRTPCAVLLAGFYGISAAAAIASPKQTANQATCVRRATPSRVNNNSTPTKSIQYVICNATTFIKELLST